MTTTHKGFSPLIDQLIHALRCLPGVGPKSAQRMAFHLLERGRDAAQTLANTLQHAVRNIGHCQRCHTFAETELCRFCSDPRRDQQLLCIVETPADVLAIEQTQAYRGLYYVLMGHLSPLDGIGPAELGIPRLLAHWQQHAPEEIILATNPTVEGEATAHYIAELARQQQTKVTRIAHGVPLGGELEFVDIGTLTRALLSRDALEES